MKTMKVLLVCLLALILVPACSAEQAITNNTPKETTTAETPKKESKPHTKWESRPPIRESEVRKMFKSHINDAIDNGSDDDLTNAYYLNKLVESLDYDGEYGETHDEYIIRFSSDGAVILEFDYKWNSEENGWELYDGDVDYETFTDAMELIVVDDMFGNSR